MENKIRKKKQNHQVLLLFRNLENKHEFLMHLREMRTDTNVPVSFHLRSWLFWENKLLNISARECCHAQRRTRALLVTWCWEAGKEAPCKAHPRAHSGCASMKWKDWSTQCQIPHRQHLSVSTRQHLWLSESFYIGTVACARYSSFRQVQVSLVLSNWLSSQSRQGRNYFSQFNLWFNSFILKLHTDAWGPAGAFNQSINHTQAVLFLLISALTSRSTPFLTPNPLLSFLSSFPFKWHRQLMKSQALTLTQTRSSIRLSQQEQPGLKWEVMLGSCSQGTGQK